MLVEVKISPAGKDPAIRKGVADIRRLIENSRSPFCLTPSRVWIEGDRGEVVALLQRCHIEAHSLSIRVVATSYAGRKHQDSGERRGAEALLGSVT
jgi:uncharacterized protein YqgV (UPF0045/DUF77 family)